jgi:hypothetical protein
MAAIVTTPRTPTIALSILLYEYWYHPVRKASVIANIAAAMYFISNYHTFYSYCLQPLYIGAPTTCSRSGSGFFILTPMPNNTFRWFINDFEKNRHHYM